MDPQVLALIACQTLGLSQLGKPRGYACDGVANQGIYIHRETQIQLFYWPGVERPVKSDMRVWGVKMGSRWGCCRRTVFGPFPKSFGSGIELLDSLEMFGFCVSVGCRTRICLHVYIYMYIYTHAEWTCTYVFCLWKSLIRIATVVSLTHKMHLQNVPSEHSKKTGAGASNSESLWCTNVGPVYVWIVWHMFCKSPAVPWINHWTGSLTLLLDVSFVHESAHSKIRWSALPGKAHVCVIPMTKGSPKWIPIFRLNSSNSYFPAQLLRDERMFQRIILLSMTPQYRDLTLLLGPSQSYSTGFLLRGCILLGFWVLAAGCAALQVLPLETVHCDVACLCPQLCCILWIHDNVQQTMLGQVLLW